eukprot:403373788
MWLKLLTKNSIEDLIKPQLVHGKWRSAAIGGRQKAQLRTYFEKAGVPWIYDKERPEVHFASPYNKKPKGDALSRNYEVRLANIRKALSTQDDRLEKYRQEKLNNKQPVAYDKIVLGVMKDLTKGENEAKKGGKQTMLAAKAAQVAEAKALGIKGPSKKQGSKTGLTSKGGQIGKKEREVMNMTKTMGGELAPKEANDDKKSK